MKLALTPAPLSLATLCGGFALILAYELAMPPQAYRLPDVPVRKPASIVLLQPSFAAQPIETFSSIDERPLFSATRKPAASPEQNPAQAGPPPAPNASLVGVIMDGKTQLAMMRSPDSAFALSYAVGSSIGGWQISEIDSDKVKLISGAFTHEIDLNANRAPPQTQGPSSSTGSQPPLPQPLNTFSPVSSAP
ncbi:MAG TPA: hypothetical protein VK779_09175 [Rhizomicrobium sp.]|jgi:hypothetical protein|nr:hypothetical protein [Rhizomicrobium sp.]